LSKIIHALSNVVQKKKANKKDNNDVVDGLNELSGGFH
jgi:hypothetical protein